MIIDKLENIKLYPNIPQHVLKFISQLENDIIPAKYQLSQTDYANVETYTTKTIDNAKFEAHEKYIDIQILLSGKENIFYDYIENLTIDTPYDNNRDIMFFKDNLKNSNYITLNGKNFAMIFPHEAHAPQAAFNNLPENVKKVVVKIKI